MIKKTETERIVELEKKVEALQAEILLLKDEDQYSAKVNADVRKKYTPSAEFAILRKTLKALCDRLGVNSTEFAELNNWVESHKLKEKNNKN